MDNKLKFQQLECYKLATDEQKEKLNKEQYFDLDKLPENQLQTEFVEYIYYRGTQVSILTIKRERHYFNSLCEFFQKSSHQEKACALHSIHDGHRNIHCRGPLIYRNSILYQVNTQIGHEKHDPCRNEIYKAVQPVLCFSLKYLV